MHLRFLSVPLWLLAAMTSGSAVAQEILLDLKLTLDNDFNFAFDPKFETGQPPEQSGGITVPGAGRARLVYSGSRLLHPKDHSAIEFQFDGSDDQFLPGTPVEAEDAEVSDESERSERPGQPFSRVWIQAFDETQAGLKVTCTLKPYSPPNSRTADGATYPRQAARLSVEWIGADQSELGFGPIPESPVLAGAGAAPNTSPSGADSGKGDVTGSDHNLNPEIMSKGKMVPPADPSFDPAIYTAPGERYRIPLPPGWTILRGQRGKIAEANFDTLQIEDGSEMLICRRQTEPAKDMMDALEAFQKQQLRLTESLELREVSATGYSTEKATWMQISYHNPASGAFEAKFATVKNSELLQFEFLSETSTKPDSGLARMQALQASIEFNVQETMIPISQPPDAIPSGAMRLLNRLDGRSRMIGVRTESAGRPAAHRLGIESPTGAVVLQTFAGLPAASAGLRPGDLVVQLGEYTVENREDFETAVFVSPIGSLQDITFVRGMERQTRKIRVDAANSDQAKLKTYISPDGTYQFIYFPTWTLHPTARREEPAELVYNYLESSDGSYSIRLYHDTVATETPVKALSSYLRDHEGTFEQSHSGWLQLGDIPAIFVSGVMTQESRSTVYRVAFVVQNRMHTLQISSPPLNDPSQLPFVVQAILGTIEQRPPEQLID
jgi:hypothetical protein